MSKEPTEQQDGPGNENREDETKCAFCGKATVVIYRVLRLRPRGLANICRDCLAVHSEEYLLDNTRPFNPWKRRS